MFAFACSANAGPGQSKFISTIPEEFKENVFAPIEGPIQEIVKKIYDIQINICENLISKECPNQKLSEKFLVKLDQVIRNEMRTNPTVKKLEDDILKIVLGKNQCNGLFKQAKI